jgi:hypothetical protein
MGCNFSKNTDEILKSEINTYNLSKKVKELNKNVLPEFFDSKNSKVLNTVSNKVETFVNSVPSKI